MVYAKNDKVKIKSREEISAEVGVNDEGELNCPLALTETDYRRFDKNNDGIVTIVSVYKDETPDGDGYDLMYRVKNGFGFLLPMFLKE